MVHPIGTFHRFQVNILTLVRYLAAGIASIHPVLCNQIDLSHIADGAEALLIQLMFAADKPACRAGALCKLGMLAGLAAGPALAVRIAPSMLAGIAAGGAGIVCVPASVGAGLEAKVTGTGAAGVSMGAGIVELMQRNFSFRIFPDDPEGIVRSVIGKAFGTTVSILPIPVVTVEAHAFHTHRHKAAVNAIGILGHSVVVIGGGALNSQLVHIRAHQIDLAHAAIAADIPRIQRRMLAGYGTVIAGTLAITSEGMCHLETAGIALMVMAAAVGAGIAAVIAYGIVAPAMFASPQALGAVAGFAAVGVFMGMVVPNHFVKSGIKVIFGDPHAVFVCGNRGRYGLVIRILTVLPVHGFCVPGEDRGVIARAIQLGAGILFNTANKVAHRCIAYA